MHTLQVHSLHPRGTLYHLLFYASIICVRLLVFLVQESTFREEAQIVSKKRECVSTAALWAHARLLTQSFSIFSLTKLPIKMSCAQSSHTVLHHSETGLLLRIAPCSELKVCSKIPSKETLKLNVFHFTQKSNLHPAERRAASVRKVSRESIFGSII